MLLCGKNRTGLSTASRTTPLLDRTRSGSEVKEKVKMRVSYEKEMRDKARTEKKRLFTIDMLGMCCQGFADTQLEKDLYAALNSYRERCKTRKSTEAPT